MKRHFFVLGHNRIINRYPISDCEINQSLDAKLFNQLTMAFPHTYRINSGWTMTRNGCSNIDKMMKTHSIILYAASLFIHSVDLFLFLFVNHNLLGIAVEPVFDIIPTDGQFNYLVQVLFMLCWIPSLCRRYTTNDSFSSTNTNFTQIFYFVVKYTHIN